MKRAPAVILLLLVTGVLYLPSLSVPFAYDDYPHFVENARILHPASLGDVFRNGKQETRPVFNASMAAQAFFSGTNPVAAHAVNVLLFLSCGLLLFLLLRRITERPEISLLASVVFLVHPMAVETVVYVNSRSGLLALLFSLAAWLALTSARKGALGTGILFLALAIGSKEDAVAAVPIAYLFQARLGDRGGWRRNVLFALPLLLIPFLYAFFRSPHVDTVGTSIEPWYRYLGSQGVLLPLHLARFFWPSPMTLNWDLSPAWIFLPVVSCGWLFLTGLTWTLWKKRRSLEALGAAWMLLALLPTHSVIPVLDVHATRISFPALPGFVLLISALVMRLPRCWAIVAAALALLFFSWRTFEEIRVWKDPVRLWETNVAAAPSRWRAWVNLGVEYGERKRWGDSWNALANAERLKPGEVEVLYNQAVVATMRTDGGADRNLARRKLAEVLRVQPDHGRAQALLHQLEGDPGTN